MSGGLSYILSPEALQLVDKIVAVRAAVYGSPDWDGVTQWGKPGAEWQNEVGVKGELAYSLYSGLTLTEGYARTDFADGTEVKTCETYARPRYLQIQVEQYDRAMSAQRIVQAWAEKRDVPRVWLTGWITPQAFHALAERREEGYEGRISWPCMEIVTHNNLRPMPDEYSWRTQEAKANGRV